MAELALLVAVGGWCFAVAVAGGLAGLVLGNIRLPVVLLVATTPAAGAGANIGISGISAATAALVHARGRRVNWRLAAWLAPPSIAGAVVGGLVSGALPGRALLLLIGVTLLVFGVDLLRPRHSAPAEPRPEELDLRAAVVSGATIGFLGGVVGLILGSLRLPALIRYVGEIPERAIGTNVVTGVAVGAAGVVGHVPGGVDWTLLAVGGAASVPGALLGARLTGRLETRTLLRAVGFILLAAGTVTLADGIRG